MSDVRSSGVLRVAVTGASGFVGGAVCRAAVSAGHHVHAFGRRAELADAHVAGAPYRSWDLSDGPIPQPPVVDAVIHCAGSVSDWGGGPAMWAANVGGTEAALASFPSPARFVHVSTASVYDPAGPVIDAREHQAPVDRYLNGYATTKAAAEDVVRRQDRDAVVLRPHAVYGPGDTTVMPRLVEAIRRRTLVLVGDGQQRISMTSIGNLVQACLLAATTPGVSGVFNVADDQPVTFGGIVSVLKREHALTPRTLHLPVGAAMIAAAGVEAVWRLARRSTAPRLTRYIVAQVGREFTLDISAARAELGYRPAATSFAGARDW